MSRADGANWTAQTYAQSHGAGPVSPDDVHVLEADLPAADAGDVRRPRPRDLHRPPRRAPTRRCRRWS